MEDLSTVTNEYLIMGINHAHENARYWYATKKQYETELRSRRVPVDAEVIDFEPEEQPGGLTSKQITRIRQWAKKKHNTEELIAFISELIKDS